MLPAGWSLHNKGPGISGSLNGPQNTPDAETQMAQLARNKIEARLRMAKLFQQYRAELNTNEHHVTVTSDPASTEEKICLTVSEKKIACNLKNLPEKLPGSQVVVTPLNQSGSPEKQTYKGWVRHADLGQVYVELCETFLNHFAEGMRVNLKFAFNRLPMRHQHRAVTQVYKHRLKEVLFPTGQLSSHHSHLNRLLDLRSNPEQHMAIQHILAHSAKPAPYLVFGPPGTGNIPPKLKLNCNLNPDENTFIIPPIRALMRCKIMVTTLLTAGRLVGGGIPPGHYAYIFVDEAGQASESECIIPIAGLLKPQRCQVVLAGDPKQLGPIITSQKAEKHGMGVSLLERLMSEVNIYQSHENYGFNNRFVTKLLRNYRSHPAILKIPNELFYESQLQPYACREQCGTYCRWEQLPKKGFPLIFHGVAGTDERDARSPSVYNMAEVEVLKGYLKTLVNHLLKKDGDSIGPGEIGIIAPYRKQVEKIQNALQTDQDLKKENLENILVGSVEKFQGKEFNVILLSTVRSNPKLTLCGQQITVGFLDNEKRFNVAMTRAQALLIVIGDPRVLKTDETWNK
ncbi:hypothetical protein L3Q82_016115 [Scortum barcoo]|uniref:Uncharacterized protein n=1 Tax=Scortum barcoo TaxID=214431 RepID=A0ACB8VQ09_9TELE|nr:hypothetical protein L3Q82_016115 [Scortum barcoo]